MTLTRATLGKIAERQTKQIEVCGHGVRLQRPTPREYSQYQFGMMDRDGKPDVDRFADCILLLTARMWIDDNGKRLFGDNETEQLGEIDLTFYQDLSAECQRFARGDEAVEMLGESEQTAGSGLLAESA